MNAAFPTLSIAFVILAALPPLASAQANEWCAEISVQVSPVRVYASDTATISVQATNRGNETRNLALRLRFGWETPTLPWGQLDLAPGDQKANSLSKPITSTPGDYLLTLALSGQSPGGAVAGCPAINRVLRVEALPPGPQVIAILRGEASPGSPVELASHAFGGVPPLVQFWTFGDGGNGTGAATNHTYAAAGTYLAQVFVIDGRGRAATDRVSIIVPGPPKDLPESVGSGNHAAGFAGSMALLANSAGLVLVGAVFLFQPFIIRRAIRGGQSTPGRDNGERGASSFAAVLALRRRLVNHVPSDPFNSRPPAQEADRPAVPHADERPDVGNIGGIAANGDPEHGTVPVIEAVAGSGSAIAAVARNGSSPATPNDKRTDSGPSAGSPE